MMSVVRAVLHNKSLQRTPRERFAENDVGVFITPNERI